MSTTSSQTLSPSPPHGQTHLMRMSMLPGLEMSSHHSYNVAPSPTGSLSKSKTIRTKRPACTLDEDISGPPPITAAASARELHGDKSGGGSSSGKRQKLQGSDAPKRVPRATHNGSSRSRRRKPKVSTGGKAPQIIRTGPDAQSIQTKVGTVHVRLADWGFEIQPEGGRSPEIFLKPILDLSSLSTEKVKEVLDGCCDITCRPVKKGRVLEFSCALPVRHVEEIILLVLNLS